MGNFASAALAVTMIAAMLLLIFGVRFALRPEDRQRGLLMIACGIIFGSSLRRFWSEGVEPR